MKIVIGLGNPEEKYTGTRHNIGFTFVDKIQKEWNFPEFILEKKFKSEISTGEFEIQNLPAGRQGSKFKILLVKPQTFMNLSGEAVREILNFYKLTPADILVIHDDLDIGVGKYKIATDSSSAGHNGVQNIIDNLGTQTFTRIRVGIGEEKEGAPICKIDAHDFVLQKFSTEELEKIQAIEKNILEEIKNILK